jgi:two-component system chemotaxis response regulator CheB
MKKEKIKVLIVDDSALVRQSLLKIIEEEPAFEVIGTASDPYFAARLIGRIAPDVITLDIQMPRMNGLTFLQKIMSQHPIPVVIISSLAKENSDMALKAWQYGAIEVIEKPMVNTKEFFERSGQVVIEAIKTASMANLKKINYNKLHHDKDIEIKQQYEDLSHTSVHKIASKVVLLGASTGGTEVVAHILSQLPVTCPPVVVVQHMPEQFTLAFSHRLDGLSAIKVKEAENGDRLEFGKAYIAPGNAHIMLNRKSQEFYIETNYGPLFNRHRPAVDVLFNSAAEFDGRHFMAAILSGMGRDGVDGLIKLKEKGALTIAQNEESCIVFGMPKEAIRANAVVKVLSPEEIIHEILKFR